VYPTPAYFQLFVVWWDAHLLLYVGSYTIASSLFIGIAALAFCFVAALLIVDARQGFRLEKRRPSPAAGATAP